MLSNLNSKDKMHALMVEKGFQRKTEEEGNAIMRQRKMENGAGAKKPPINLRGALMGQQPQKPSRWEGVNKLMDDRMARAKNTVSHENTVSTSAMEKYRIGQAYKE
uniref:Uncharacterized protein n=1 Tax=Helicotheca tamesis TaxID=374047 RepID=A0A7S2IE04_9STRA|mmetsp:Transcript_7932/g.10923  ORF Transcript_7932/g.10923 Transcript_7932/m.10923 type:complete len:106 (+) Transcript_7932:349-666(+)